MLPGHSPIRTAESMKVIDLTGDGQDELFIQNTSNVVRV